MNGVEGKIASGAVSNNEQSGGRATAVDPRIRPQLVVISIYQL
jgi:hypothetical protein